MPKHDFSDLSAHYPETIEAMPATFISHQFVLRLAQQHQRLYIEALHNYRDEPAPFRTVHGILAKHLHAHPELIELARQDALSTDIFGQSNQCAKWRKLSREPNRMEGRHLPVCQEYERAFEKVDDTVARIGQFQVRPDFSRAMTERTNRTPDLGLADDAILKRLIMLVAYSNNAKASAVSKIVRSGILDVAFRHYDVQEVANLEPTYVVQEHWSQMKAIRFKYKVDRMIECAKRLLDIQSQYGSFMQYLREQNIPASIRTVTDLHSFWNGFDAVMADFKAMRIPYFRNLTSLCHLLLNLGYDCAKTGSAIMKAAVNLKIASPPRKKGTFSEEERRKVVRFMQIYAMCKGIRTPVVDLYFLIHGGQTNAARLVDSTYYL